MRTKTHFMSFAVSQLPVVQFEHVRTLFDSTQSQESKSEISLRKRARQCALLTILCPLLFLSSLWSNLSMWGHFLIVLNLRNPNLRSACAKERGNAHYWPFYVLCCFSAPSGPIWACEDTFWEYSQKSKSEIDLHRSTRQCALWPILRPNLYLWCLRSH